MQNYYEILGVSTNATEQEIRTSYIEKIKKYHPDTFDGDKSFAEKQTSLITEAYTTLKDETLRKRYDLRNNISSTSPKQTSNPQQQQKPSAKKKTEKAQKTKPQNEQKEDTIKTDKKAKKQQKGQEKPVQNDKNKAKKPKYTKKQVIEDIFIVVLSALLITILVLAIF